MPENSTKNKPLTYRQQKAIALLMAGKDKSAVAQEIGISRNTLYKWQKQENFRAALRKAEAALVSDIAGQLARLGSKAQSVLSEQMKEESSPQALSAARAVLGFIPKFLELAQFEERLSALEEALEDKAA